VILWVEAGGQSFIARGLNTLEIGISHRRPEVNQCMDWRPKVSAHLWMTVWVSVYSGRVSPADRVTHSYYFYFRHDVCFLSSP